MKISTTIREKSGRDTSPKQTFSPQGLSRLYTPNISPFAIRSEIWAATDQKVFFLLGEVRISV